MNILKSMRFAEQFRDFSRAEVKGSTSEAYNKQGTHLALIKFNVTSSDAVAPSVFNDILQHNSGTDKR